MGYPAFVVLFALIAAVLGVVTATSGLLSRYADEPLAAVRSRGGSFYLAINAALAIIAYFVLVATVPADAPLAGPPATPVGGAGEPDPADPEPPAAAPATGGADPDPASPAPGAGAASQHTPLRLLSLALFGGLGAVVLLRVQFSLVFQGEQRSIGPGSVIDAILSTIDTAIDRDSAIRRADLVADQMQGISFERAKIALPLLISGARRTVGRDQLDRLGGIVKEIESSPCSEELKSISLGFALLDVTGEELFRRLIGKFKAHFGLDRPAPDPDPNPDPDPDPDPDPAVPDPATPKPEPEPEPVGPGGHTNGDTPPKP